MRRPRGPRYFSADGFELGYCSSDRQAVRSAVADHARISVRSMNGTS